MGKTITIIILIVAAYALMPMLLVAAIAMLLFNRASSSVGKYSIN